MIQSHVVPNKYLFEINADCMIQLGIEVNHPKYVDMIIHNLSKTIIGLHLKLDRKINGHALITHTDEDPPIFKITEELKNTINQNKLEQLSEIFINKYYTPPTTRFGSIGYKDRHIILNLSHSVGDGRYLKYIVENLNSYLINNKEESLNYKQVPYFPRESTDIFKDLIEKAPDPKSGWWNQSKVNRVYSKKIKKTTKQDKNEPTKCKYITTRIPANQLINNTSSKKIHNITNSLLTSIYIASNVHNYSDSSKFQFDDYISMPVCVDLRRYMDPQKIDYSICNNFSNVTPYSIISSNDTISSVGHKMKADMFRLMKEGRDIGNLKTYLKMDFSKNKKIELNPKNGCGVELTYTGPVQFKEPIVDIWNGHSMNVRSSTISLMGFSIVDEKGKNEIVTRLRFPPNVFDYEEALNMSKSIEFCLKNIPGNCTIREAIEKTMNNISY